jgi:hypothetical protein
VSGLAVFLILILLTYPKQWSARSIRSFGDANGDEEKGIQKDLPVLEFDKGREVFIVP